MKIRIANLKEGLNSWREVVTPDALELDANIFRSEITIDFKVSKRTGRIDAQVSAFSMGDFSCDRCSEDFRRLAGGTQSVHFIRRDAPFPDEMPGDELRSFQSGQDELDVFSEMRDALLLSIPLQVFCRDDCKGICLKCGTNLNHEACKCNS